MDWMSAKHWPKGAGFILALLFAIGLVSFHLDDPSLTNLRTPSQGIQNWLGLPGALLGGTLIEFLGSAALAAPLLLLNFSLSPRNRPHPLAYLAWSMALLGGLSSLHGLWATATREAMLVPGLEAPGLVGLSLRHWAAQTTGPLAGSAIALVVVFGALNRVGFHPLLRKALADTRLFALWGARESAQANRKLGQRLGLGSRRLGQGIGLGGRSLVLTLGRVGGSIMALLLGPPRAIGGWISAWRMPSVGKIKARHTHEEAESLVSEVSRRGESGATMPASDIDPFDAWMAHSSNPSPSAPIVPEPISRQDGHSGSPFQKPPRDLMEALDAISSPPEELPPSNTPSPLAASSESSPAGTPLLENEHEEALPQASPLEEDKPSASTDSGLRTQSESLSGKDKDVDEAEQDFPDPAYEFEQPQAEAAWRERFQRYARNLDLDWQDQLWGEASREDGESLSGEDETDPDAKRE